MLSALDMNSVFAHYQRRLAAHEELGRYFETKKIERYTDLALGIARPEGNYSASEHNLGPQVLSNNTRESVFKLAEQLMSLHDAYHVPQTIYQANMPCLRISVGSEMAMMLDPNRYWVGNVRTIYSYLLLKHKANRPKADDELRLYREPDGRRPSAMEYRIWRDLYLSLERTLKEIAGMGTLEAQKQGASAGTHVYMWADAICSMIYSDHA